MRKPHAKWKRMTPEIRQRIVALASSGLPYAEIGADVGYTASAVQVVAAKAGIRRMPNRPLPASAMVAAYQVGVSTTAQAEQLGVTHTTVRKLLKAYGVQLRLRGRIPKVPIERIVWLRHRHGLSYPRIAALVGLTHGTVRTRYLRWKRRQEASAS